MPKQGPSTSKPVEVVEVFWKRNCLQSLQLLQFGFNLNVGDAIRQIDITTEGRCYNEEEITVKRRNADR